MKPFIQAEPMKFKPKTGAEVRNLTILPDLDTDAAW